MERTYTLIHSLTEAEKEYLRHSLSFVPSNNKGRENLLLKLFEFLLSCKESPSLKECLEGIYGNNDLGKKIINLRSRLYRKMLDLVIADSELHRNKVLDEQDLEWILEKKRMAQFYALFYSGRGSTLSMQLLEEILTSCKEYEHYLGVIECLRFKKWIVGLIEGIDYYNKIQKEIVKFEFKCDLVNKAVDILYTLNITGVFKANQAPGRTKLLKKAITGLKRDNKIALSKVTDYYISVLEIDYLIGSNQYKKAHNKCLKLIKFINTHKAVYRKQRLASVYCNLSRCELFVGELKAADRMANQALMHFHFGTTNYSIAKEQEFYARFWMKDYPGANESLQCLFRNPKQEHGEFFNSKYEYFKACLHFQKNEFSEALKILSKHQDLCKDKDGWDISVRVLRLMCHLELDHKEQAILDIESFRKHIEKYSLILSERKRHQLVLEIFKMMERRDFSFNIFPAAIALKLSKLKVLYERLENKLLGPELIPVISWLETSFNKKNGKRSA